MTPFYRPLCFLCISTLVLAANLGAQEALEIRGDQEGAAAEPTPIRERSEPAPPAEGESEAEPEATPKKKKPANTVQEMSPEEFKRAGLDKLSPEELKTLNEWLRGYKMQAESRAAAEVTEQAREEGKREGREEARSQAKKEFNRNWLSTDKIYSRIQGQFHGLGKGGKKIFIVLEDGTVWKQANEMDKVQEPKLVDNPPCMITHSLAGYKMHVIGAGSFWVNPYKPKN
ncbi:MAG TPA: hypothetical protein VJ719_10780 [Chthoniobacterales bacterium]|nr:hypothetical protein [Chthoniobacterales bacterium]